MNEFQDTNGTWLAGQPLAEAILQCGVSRFNLVRLYYPGWDPDLSGADFRGADLRRIDLAKVDLERANLVGADLEGACLYEANCAGADFSGANLCTAVLCGATLRGATLCTSDLRFTDLGEADLSGVDLDMGNNLRGADLSEAKLSQATFSPMQLLFQVNWGRLSQELTVECMKWDRALRVRGDGFPEWASGGKCPYRDGNGEARSLHFRENRKWWENGLPTMSLRELFLALCEEKGIVL